MPSLRSLYKEYLTSLPLAGLHVNSGARRWTESVKIYWAQKGDENGFQVWANRVNYRSRNFTGHEYMLDLIWRRTNIQTNQIQLALECEWQSRKEPQEHDFQKLVYVKARQKVFIFQFYRDRDPFDRVRELMRFATFVAGYRKGELHTLETETGAQMSWGPEASNPGRLPGDLVADETHLYTMPVLVSERINAVELRTGRVAWSYPATEQTKK